MRVARRAGTYPARSATAIIAAAAAPMASGSYGVRPNSRLETNRPPASASSRPMTTPATPSRAVSPSSSKRHANAEFVRPPRDAVGGHAVDADGRQQDGQEAEHRGQLRDRPPVDDSKIDQAAKRDD